MKVLLLAGGWSPEREVSLKGGEQIAAILFSQEKDAKVIQGVRPLDIPLMGLAAFPAVWAAPTGAGRRALGLAKTTAVLPAVELRLTPQRDFLHRQVAGLDWKGCIQ